MIITGILMGQSCKITNIKQQEGENCCDSYWQAWLQGYQEVSSW